MKLVLFVLVLLVSSTSANMSWEDWREYNNHAVITSGYMELGAATLADHTMKYMVVPVGDKDPHRMLSNIERCVRTATRMYMIAAHNFEVGDLKIALGPDPLNETMTAYCKKGWIKDVTWKGETEPDMLDTMIIQEKAVQTLRLINETDKCVRIDSTEHVDNSNWIR